jgi:pyruvate/2-oxoglutarate dehydrogenase complex dihydrolipoamide acyltransferase (E2) component
MYEELQQDEKGRWYYQLPEDLKYVPKVEHVQVPCSTVLSIDMTDADSFRKKLQKKTGVHISITSLIIKAATNAVVDFPILCGVWEGADRIICPAPGEATVHGPIQVGNEGGFFYIERANQKALPEVSKELDAQVAEVRSARRVGHPPGEEQAKPGLDITNVGTIGPAEGGFSAPWPLFTSLLGICAILERPAVKDGQIRIRKLMNVILSWDHSAMMGDTSIEFLAQLKRNLEEPDSHLV